MINQRTKDLYDEVLENVIRSVGDGWRESNGDFNILTNIGELWKYETYKRCKLPCEEPQSQCLKRAQQKNDTKNEEDLLKLFSGGFQQLDNNNNDSTDSSSGSQKSSTDSGSDLQDSDADSNKSDGSESDDSESDDGLGDDTDDEVNSMVQQIQARDRLFCEYTYESKKRKKGTKSFTLNVINCHFTIDGIPRVVKNGIISFT